MRTSGSSGRRSYAALSLAVIAREAHYLPVLCDAHGLLGSPIAIWGPPSLWALSSMLRHLKADIPVSRFYASRPVFASGETMRAGLALAAAALAARSAGRRIPLPRPAPPLEMSGPARWLAEMRRSGRTAALNLPPAAAVRLAATARQKGLDISGAVLWNGSEPLTAAKAALVRAAGVRSMNVYSQTELGIVALGCADPGEADDLHIAVDRLMVISRQKQLAGAGGAVPALLYTTTSLQCRTVMINVETGDYGRLEERRCGCPLGELGLDTHLTGLRAYDRLTLRSLGFQGERLYELVDELLPGRFGGQPGDYQLLEEEAPSGALSLRVLASPRLGALDADAVAASAAGFLAGPEGRALPPIAVERREPYLINGRKTPPLHRLAAAGSPRPGA